MSISSTIYLQIHVLEEFPKELFEEIPRIAPEKHHDDDERDKRQQTTKVRQFAVPNAARVKTVYVIQTEIVRKQDLHRTDGNAKLCLSVEIKNATAENDPRALRGRFSRAMLIKSSELLLSHYSLTDSSKFNVAIKVIVTET